MDDLYRDYILEHYRQPHNFGVVEDADASYEGSNPLCGDRITLMLGVKDGVVDRVATPAKDGWVSRPPCPARDVVAEPGPGRRSPSECAR